MTSQEISDKAHSMDFQEYETACLTICALNALQKLHFGYQYRQESKW